MSDADPLYQLYNGFFIESPTGNNAFSYSLRKNKKIWVPHLIPGGIDDIKTGEKVVFSELEDGYEINRTGLENFVHIRQSNKDIFIFDNHNHAFVFWCWAIFNNKIRPGGTLIHIDQHTDMREPDQWPEKTIAENRDLNAAFNYANKVLNVGNFIRPALEFDWFASVEMITTSVDFKKPVTKVNVVDVDLDIFAPELDYIDSNIKIGKIRKFINQNDFITIATSPFFMDQDKAIQIIHEIFD
jgi:hypothetical protein